MPGNRVSALPSTSTVWSKWKLILATAVVLAVVTTPLAARGAGDPSTIRFSMVRSAAAEAAGCLANARARVRIGSIGPVENIQPPFPDASVNPATAPVHTFHLGLWFNDPADAQAAGCPNAVTPFNGDHNAGFQILSTRNFADDQGPLRQLGP